MDEYVDPSYSYQYGGDEYLGDVNVSEREREQAQIPGMGIGALALPLLLGAGAALGPVLGGGSAAGIAAGVLPVVAAAGAAFGGLQALGLGEGEGLFGLDILGGGDGAGIVEGPYGGKRLDGIPMGGPGLAEPPAQWVIKEWHVNYSGFKLQYYLVQMPNGRRKIALYNSRTKAWKSWPWRTPSVAHIGKNMPSHKMITRLRRNLSKHKADAQTILKLADPIGYAKKLSYHKHQKRR